MRYVNLKKRNTTKFQYISKRFATLSLLSLMFLSVIIVPLTVNSDKNNVLENNPITIIDDHDLGNDAIEALEKDEVEETNK